MFVGEFKARASAQQHNFGWRIVFAHVQAGATAYVMLDLIVGIVTIGDANSRDAVTARIMAREQQGSGGCAVALAQGERAGKQTKALVRIGQTHDPPLKC